MTAGTEEELCWSAEVNDTFANTAPLYCYNYGNLLKTKRNVLFKDPVRTAQ